MAIPLVSFNERDISLLGEDRLLVYTSQTATGISDLNSAFQVSDKAIDVQGSDGLRIRIGADDYFILSLYDWTGIQAAAAGNALSENTTALRIYSETDPAVYILVGKTSGNHILVQKGTYTRSSAGAFIVAIDVFEHLGGVLDHRIAASGIRRSLVMVARNASRPNAPSGIRDNGRSLNSVQVNGVWWHQGGRYAIPGTGGKEWFAFGESRYDDLRGRLHVQDSWQIVDATGATQAANITFGSSWRGPWSDPPYVFGTHTYARVRSPNGSFRVWPLLPSTRPLDREWRLLSETYIDGSAYRAQPYTTTLAFDFHPDEFRMMKMEFEWEDFSSESGKDKSFGFFDPQDVPVAPVGIRSASQYQPKVAGLTMQASIRRNQGILLSASSDTVSAGNTETINMSLRFETADSTTDLPLTVFRVIDRDNTSKVETGWLRWWVL